MVWITLPQGIVIILEDFSTHDNFEFLEGDIRDLETCQKACKGIDMVLHQAALGSVPRS